MNIGAFSTLRHGLRRLPGFGRMQAVYHLLRAGDARASALLRLTGPRALFQPFGVTGPDRYPEIFAFLRDAIGDGDERRILSFGCSTGEEVFSLRGYFPRASLRGIDISTRRIAIAQGRVPAAESHRITFAASGSAQQEPAEHYDAVLAMAVFRHGDLTDGPATSRGRLDFGRFEAEVSALARAVKPGGYLAIRHANFRFADTVAARGFAMVLEDDNITPNYDPAGDKLPYAPQEACVFRKPLG